MGILLVIDRIGGEACRDMELPPFARQLTDKQTFGEIQQGRDVRIDKKVGGKKRRK